MFDKDLFDEKAYLALYPDVKSAVEAGGFLSGMQHYELCGHAESRKGLLPPGFSAETYMRMNPAVGRAIERGEIPSAGYHYLTVGKVVRLPFTDIGSSKTALTDKIWRGRDPFSSIPADLYATDTQGWNSEHPYLQRAISEVKPALAIEIGVWKGGSTMTLARALKDQKIDGVILSVDTWLGSSEHWINPDNFSQLLVKNGYPHLFYKFASNIINAELEDFVVPLPTDSLNARVIALHFELEPGVIHIDAGHDYRSVLADLQAWWPLLKPGGVLIADDYFPDGEGWPGVLKAVDEFFSKNVPSSFEALAGKAYVRKP